jgi:PAS domain S-box-containing protein
MRTLWRPLVIVSGLVLVLTYFLVQGRSPDLVLRIRMHEELQTLALHDAELTRDVLLARAGLLINYDPLIETERRLRGILQTLRRESATVSGGAGREIGAHVEELARLLEEKLALVEYFKSDNALLRNSSTYFGHTGQRLREEFRSGGRVPTAEVAAVSQAMLELVHSPGGASRDEARRALDHLSRAPGRRPDGETLATHGYLILATLPAVDALLGQIVAAPVPARVEAVQEVVLRHANRVEARAQVFRVLMYLVAVTLMGYVLYQVGRIRATARDLRRANLNLEHEVAERREAAAALRTSEERFRAITESANDAIVSADTSGRLASWNGKAEGIFGYRPDEILGTSLVGLMPQRYHRFREGPFAGRVAARLARLAGRTFEFTGRRKDGSEFPLEISLSRWSTAHGNYVTGMIRDLTARKRLEETTRQQELQLIQANKMTALGTLVSGVAHEINSPTHLVLMNTRILSDAWADALEVLDSHHQRDGQFALAGLAYPEMRATIPSLLEDVQDGARRIERIVSDLRNFSRPPATRSRGPFVVNDAVRRALRLLAHVVQDRTRRFEVALADDMPVMEGDVQQIGQVVVNLVMNALEALPDRDHGVRVSTAFDTSEHTVVLEVSDEGVGISPEHLGRVCDPFFTTKRETGGTGLGLAITSSLVRAHGGQLTLSSKPGGGTRAVVTIPFPSRAERGAVGTAD